MKLEQTKKEIS